MRRGGSAEICTKPPQIRNAAVQKTRKAPKGADADLRHNVSDADAAPLKEVCSRATGLKV